MPNFVASTTRSRRPSSASPIAPRRAVAAVDVGRVEEGDAGIQRRVDHRARPGEVEPPAEVVAAEAHGGDREIRASKGFCRIDRSWQDVTGACTACRRARDPLPRRVRRRRRRSMFTSSAAGPGGVRWLHPCSAAGAGGSRSARSSPSCCSRARPSPGCSCGARATTRTTRRGRWRSGSPTRGRAATWTRRGSSRRRRRAPSSRSRCSSRATRRPRARRRCGRSASATRRSRATAASRCRWSCARARSACSAGRSPSPCSAAARPPTWRGRRTCVCPGCGPTSASTAQILRAPERANVLDADGLRLEPRTRAPPACSKGSSRSTTRGWAGVPAPSCATASG